jgi:ammonia channel protein AmtB
LGHQAALGFAGLGYSLVVTFIILWIIDLIPGFHLTADVSEQKEGMDETEVGEVVYKSLQEREHNTWNNGTIGGTGAAAA